MMLVEDGDDYLLMVNGVEHYRSREKQDTFQEYYSLIEKFQ
ncbi:hypothetical protein [Paenibacillus gallinarum]|nr:hypothetical protein [Paenibacillus gallinarum]